MENKLGSKALAGTLPGFALAFALAGIYGLAGPGTLQDRYIVVLWLIAPVWLAILSATFLFRRAWHAWAWLAAANALAYAALFLLRPMAS